MLNMLSSYAVFILLTVKIWGPYLKFLLVYKYIHFILRQIVMSGLHVYFSEILYVFKVFSL